MKSFVWSWLVAFAFASTDAATNETVRNGSHPFMAWMTLFPCASGVVQNPRFSTRSRFGSTPLSSVSGGSSGVFLLDIKLNGPQGGQFAVFLTPEGQQGEPPASAGPVAVVEQDAPCAWQVVARAADVVVSYDPLDKCSQRPEYRVNVTVSSVAAICAQDPSNRVCKYNDVVAAGGVQDVTEATTCKKVALSSLPKPETSVATTTPLSSALALLVLVLAATTSTMMAVSN